jgi:hypothetical protein
MLSSRLTHDRVLTVVFAGLVAACVPASTWAADKTPRTASGRPDLSGTYDAATLTPLTRPAAYGDNLYLTREEAEKIAADEAKRNADRSQASDPNREAPPDGGDGSPGAAGNVGGYNTFWIDRGNDAFAVDGKFRTSILIDPKNGQMPPMTPEAQKRLTARFGEFRRENDGTAWWLENDGPGPYDDMEVRNSAERCLLGFTGTAPTFPSLYNNFKRIVQTDDHVVILLEMVHDARVVRMNSKHPGPEVKKWLGDSIGWWEGDTLVVETTNFRADSGPGRGGSENARVTERFSRMPDGNVLYGFTVEDATVWTAPWTGEYVWRASSDRVFEYACHEGNYALGNIMRGARLLEKDWVDNKVSAKKQ